MGSYIKKCVKVAMVGKPCKDGDKCTKDDKCNADGQCVGTPDRTCCSRDEDCKNLGVCRQ
jgi:hypothetical protein